MDSTEALVTKLIGIQYKVLSDFESSTSLSHERSAQFVQAAEVLKAQRELAAEYFTHNLNAQKQLYQSANHILDIAIDRGDLTTAQIALIVIQEGKAKEIV